jgi:hypothetical protein
MGFQAALMVWIIGCTPRMAIIRFRESRGGMKAGSGELLRLWLRCDEPDLKACEAERLTTRGMPANPTSFKRCWVKITSDR